jgi:natural product precursor
MKPLRRLALKREHLADLAADDMLAVVGGTHIPTDCGCITHGYSCDDCPIPSLPINTCLCTIVITIGTTCG